MRKILVLFAVITAALAMVAKAQTPVIDASNLAQNVQQLAQDIAAVEQLKSQLTQLENTYAMFTSIPNVNSIATALQNPSIQNPMPVTNALTALLGGTTAPTGNGLNYYQQQHVYTPTDNAQASTLSTSNAQSIANIQGMATTNLAAIQARLQNIPSLESALSSATSITQVAAINGRIMTESQFVQSQQAQAANLQVLAKAQSDSQIQQGHELVQQESSQLSSALQSVNGNR
jgi:Type IV secretion system proteins